MSLASLSHQERDARVDADAAQPEWVRRLVLVPPPPVPDSPAQPANTPEAFVARLKAARERRGVTLTSIAESTKISPVLLTALERNNLSRWPGGIFRRSFFASYVQAIGLPVEPMVAEFLRMFPDEDAPALPVRAASARAAALARVVAPARAFAAACVAVARMAAPAHVVTSARVAPSAVADAGRLTLAGSPRPGAAQLRSTCIELAIVLLGVLSAVIVTGGNPWSAVLMLGAWYGRSAVTLLVRYVRPRLRRHA
jgi:transcriptional regulator with XRE-family HTH domain